MIATPLTEPPVPQTDQSCAQVNGIEHAMYISMMMTVCWMDRMTALESPDVAGGRYSTRGGGDFLTAAAAAAAELPFVSFALPFFRIDGCCNWGDVEAIEDVIEESAVSEVLPEAGASAALTGGVDMGCNWNSCLECAEEFARSWLSSAVAIGSSLASESTIRVADSFFVLSTAFEFVAALELVLSVTVTGVGGFCLFKLQIA